MQIDDDVLAVIQTLWDELADFGVAEVDGSCRHMLAGLCGLVDARNANWIGVVRMDSRPSDPVRGWRPRLIRFLHPEPRLASAAAEQTRRLERGQVDPLMLYNLERMGQFRCNRLTDCMAPAWFEQDYYRRFYLDTDRRDSIWACMPINEDAEVFVGLHRGLDRPPYAPEERDRIAYALRGLRWFHRQQMLGLGLLVASAPLSDMERVVLRELLAGQTEKQVAQALGINVHTVHEYVVRIYRKYGVRSRAALTALWLMQS